MLTTYLTVALVAYLLGSIPFGYILVRLFLKQDIRQTGSGNIGATNVARSGKKGLAIATLLLDAAKGTAAAWFGVVAVHVYFMIGGEILVDPYPNAWNACFAALFALIGHCFPVWLKFHGGKGVATAVGAFLVVAPAALGVSVLVFIIVFALSRWVSLSSIISALIFPALVYKTNPDVRNATELILISLCSALIILKHRSNIRRLLNGTEPKFGAKKPALPADPIQVEKNA